MPTEEEEEERKKRGDPPSERQLLFKLGEEIWLLLNKDVIMGEPLQVGGEISHLGRGVAQEELAGQLEERRPIKLIDALFKIYSQYRGLTVRGTKADELRRRVKDIKSQKRRGRKKDDVSWPKIDEKFKDRKSRLHRAIITDKNRIDDITASLDSEDLTQKERDKLGEELDGLEKDMESKYEEAESLAQEEKEFKALHSRNNVEGEE